MTVKQLLNLREDCDDAIINYYVLRENGNNIELTYNSRLGRWLNWDYDYDDDDEIIAEICLDVHELLNAEIVSIRLGNFTEVTVRV